MATVTITGGTGDAGALGDDRPWKLWAASYQPDGNGGVITTRADREANMLRPIAGALKFKAEAGIAAYLENPDGHRWLITIPEVDTPLWDVIEAAVAYPPETAQESLNAAMALALPPMAAAELAEQVPTAVDADLSGRQFTWEDAGGGEGYPAVGGTPIGDPRPWPSGTWSGTAGKPELPLDASVEGGLDKTGTTNVRSALNTLVQTVDGARPIHFPKGRYRLGSTGASSGLNSISLPSGTKITADPGAVFEVNQLDYQSSAAIFRAEGTDGAKQNLTSDITYSVFGRQTVTLPSGVAATFSPGDLIGFESRAVSAFFEGYEDGGANTLTSEIAKIEYIDGNTVTLDHPLYHAYLTADSAQFWKITPVKDVHISGLVFEPGPGVTPGAVGQFSNAIRFAKTLNCSVDNVHISNMIGGIDLYDAYDTRIDNVTVERLLRQDSSIGAVTGGYGVFARGRTTNLLINSAIIRDCRHAFTTGPDLRGFNGTAQSGSTSTTVVLAAGSSSVDGFYVNGSITINSGTGSGQSRKITAYNGATKVATVDTAWTVTPTSSSVYSIYQGWGQPMYIKINDSIGYGGSNGGTAIWDTHEQGLFIEFNNCTAIGGDPTRNPSGTGATMAGFQIRSKHTKINNPKVFFTPRYGIVFTNSASNGMVDGGEIAYGGGVGIMIQGVGVTVKDVDIHHNNGHGIATSSNATVQVASTFIKGCRIYENNNYGIYNISADSILATGTVIQGCYIPKGTIQGGSILANTAATIIKDCIMSRFGTSGLGIGIFSPAADLKYANCYGDNGIIGNTNHKFSRFHGTSFSEAVVGTRLSAETTDRFTIGAGGDHSWAGSSAAMDTTLGRTAANLLSLGAGDSLAADGTWNGGQFRMGANRFWVDGTGALRVKTSAPSSDTDGTLVGGSGGTVSPANTGVLWTPAPAYLTGYYYWCNSPGDPGTSAALGFDTTRLSLWIVFAPLTIQSLIAEYTVAGSAGTTFTPYVYACAATGRPAALLLDPGSIATDGTPGTIEKACSLTLAAGAYWVGGAVRGSGTQPTMRTISTRMPQNAFLPLSNSLPAAGASAYGYSVADGGTAQNPYAGLTPASGTSTIPRIGFRVV